MLLNDSLQLDFFLSLVYLKVLFEPDRRLSLSLSHAYTHTQEEERGDGTGGGRCCTYGRPGGNEYGG